MKTHHLALEGRGEKVVSLPTRLSAAYERALRPGHDAALDGIRGLAVALVFLVHIHRIVGPLTPEDGGLAFALRAVSATGQVGVYLFFVLSGFLIYGIVLARRPPYARFLWRRIQRIYPTYLSVALLHIVISLAWPAVSKLPDGAFARAEYIVRALILLPGVAPEPPLVTVAWTLRFEMAFYLLVGLLVFAPALLDASRKVRVTAALLAVALMLSTPSTAVASMFLFGMLAREAHGAWREAHIAPGAAWLFGAAAVPASFFMFLPEIAGDYPSMPDFIAGASRLLRFLVLGPILTGIVVLAARGGNAIARIAAWGPVRLFGIISYSYYLSHGIAIHFVERVLVPAIQPGHHSTLLAFGLLVLSFGLTVLVATGFFIFVEFPFSIGRRVAY